MTASDFSFNSIGLANFSFGSGAGQTLSTQRDQVVGNTSGQVVSQTGGSNTVGSAAVPRNLSVGYFAVGTYNLSGSAALTVYGNEIIGSNGTGTFTQSGGTHVVGGDMLVGSGSSGTLQVNGGSLTASNITLGEPMFGVPGTLSITGGTTNVSGVIDLLSGVATATMSGGTLNVGRLALPNAASLNWSGGTINSAASVSISPGPAVAGDTTLLLSGGNLTLGSSKSLATSGSERLGLAAGPAGAGAIAQTGGSNTIGAALELAYAAGSTATYNVQGGSASAGNVYVGGNAGGSAGTGTLNISGGTLSHAGHAPRLEREFGCELVGPRLSVAALDLGGDPSRFKWTGGNLTFTSGNVVLETGGLIGDTVPVARA